VTTCQPSTLRAIQQTGVGDMDDLSRRRKIRDLWQAANIYCRLINGHWLDPAQDGAECPPCPEDDLALQMVIDFLRGVG
jgi:hypothetical protein